MIFVLSVLGKWFHQGCDSNLLSQIHSQTSYPLDQLDILMKVKHWKLIHYWKIDTWYKSNMNFFRHLTTSECTKIISIENYFTTEKFILDTKATWYLILSELFRHLNNSWMYKNLFDWQLLHYWKIHTWYIAKCEKIVDT